ncbi:hypothetical protein MMC13_003666 [Lambiella insularis]|nr:hypothetical protein [Lambiella insularis]
MPVYIDCQSISAECPVSASIYGYYPNLGANIFFAILFGTCFVLQTFQGFRYKSYAYAIPIGLGCLAECIGYIGRIIMHSNPFSNTGFEMQICCLIMAPAFIAWGIYLVLRGMVYSLGPQFSPIPPNWYYIIFIVVDVISLVLQAAGGATAATSKGNKTQANAGGHAMLAGIAWQVFTLIVFVALSGLFLRRVMANRSSLDVSAQEILKSGRFHVFLSAVAVAFLGVFTRCVYRIPELANGWASTIMQNEVDFIVLDGTMIAIAAIALTAVPSGRFFPEMHAQWSRAEVVSKHADTPDVEVGEK